MKINVKVLLIRLSLAFIFSVILVTIFVPRERIFAIAVLVPMLTGLAYIFEALKK